MKNITSFRNIRDLMVLTKEVSLGVISLQGRQSPTYNEHIPMNELHTVMQPSYLGKFPTTGSRHSLNISLLGYFFSWC